MALLVISLTDKPRNPTLMSDLRAMGFNPTLVTAVDARRWSAPFAGHPVDTEAFVDYYGRLPSGGEVGCALSHLRCYQIAVERGHEWTIVLEEDAVIQETFADIAEVLDALTTTKPRVLTFRALWSPIMRRKSLQQVVSDGGRRITVGALFVAPYLTIGYAINAAAAAEAASHQHVTGTADWPPWAHAFDFWGMYLWPVSIHESESTLQAERTQAESGMKSTRPSRFIVVRVLAYLEIQKINIWRRSLGGIKPYLQHIAFPRMQSMARKRGQTDLTDAPDSPRIR